MIRVLSECRRPYLFDLCAKLAGLFVGVERKKAAFLR